MTTIQNNRKANQENARANAASEALQRERNEETARANRAHEQETRRSNKAREKETARANAANEAYRMADLDIRKKTAIGTAIGQTVGGIGTAALLFNDIAWYAKSKEFCSSVLSLPDQDALGTTYPPIASTIYGINGESEEGQDPNERWDYSGPSILTANTIPTIGRCTGINSFAMRAANELWTSINENNGRNSAYEPTDVMMYQIGLAGLALFIGFLEKAYAWQHVYSSEDATLPRGILESMGLDADDLCKNRFQLRSLIQDMRAFANTYRFVPNFYLADRWYFAYRSVMCDTSDSTHVQWYHYVPAAFPLLDVTGVTTTIRMWPWKTDALGYLPSYKFNDLFDLAQTMKNSFLLPQDTKIMNSDIKSFFGENATKLFSDTDFPENVVPSVSRDPNALYQFRNMKGNGSGWDGTGFDITERSTIVNETSGASVSYLECKAQGFSDHTVPATGGPGGCIVEWANANITPESLIEATRLMPVYTDTAGAVRDSFFTEVPINLQVVDFATVLEDTSSFNTTTIRYRTLPVEYYVTLGWSDLYTAEMIANVAAILSTSMAFKYAPIRLIQCGGTTGTSGKYSEPFVTSQWENFVWMPYNTLIKANNRIAIRMLGGNQ